MNCPKILPIPNEPWVYRLRRGNKVWLAKENELATVEWEYEPPEPGHLVGRINIRREPVHMFGNQTWYISNTGCGFNGSQLFIPIEGHLLENPPELPTTEIRKIYRALELIKLRLENLENNSPVEVIDALGVEVN